MRLIKIFSFIGLIAIFSLTFSQEKVKRMEQPENTSVKAKVTVEEINDLIHLSDSLLTSLPDQSLTYAKQALYYGEQQNYDLGRLLSKLNIAEIYARKSDIKNALKFAYSANDLATQLGGKQEMARATLLIGQIYVSFGDYEEGSKLIFKALQIYEEINDNKGIGECLNMIGLVYYKQKNFEKALEYYTRSLNVARKLNDLIGISRGLNNKASANKELGILKDYVADLNEAISINKKIGRKSWIGVNYLNLGEFYSETNKPDTALAYLNKANNIFTTLNNLDLICASLISFSDYYSKLNNLGKSISYAKQANTIGEKNNLKESIYESAVRLHNLYLKQKKIDSAYKYSIVEYQMKDSLNIEKGYTRISQLELMYKYENAKQKERFKQQRKENRIFIIGIVVFSIMLILIITFITRNKIKAQKAIIAQKKLENELEKKTRELTTNVMGLMKKNEIISEVSKKLIDVSSDALKDETKTAINSIVRELRKSTENEISEEFEVRFNEVHPGFYDKLLEKFPTISPNEQRLCAFLRLNMTSKEISELTGQRIQSIDVARSRLRKKLGISNKKTNLITFLAQI